MAKAKKQTEKETIEVMEINHIQMDVFVVGSSPLVLNRMSEKAKHQLLCPRGRLNSAEKQTNLKHNPKEEFLAAPHRVPGGPTLLALPSTAFKGALSTAAKDLPGTNKSQIGRLTYVEGEYVPVWGVPKLYMATVRSADMNRTPDIRTRVIIPEWVAKFTITFVTPLLTAQAVTRLIAAGGVYIGVGDGRPEKGKLSFGRYRLVGENDKDLKRIMNSGGRKIQETAMKLAEPYDEESREMLEWFEGEISNRNFQRTGGIKKGKNARIKPNGSAHEVEPIEITQ